VTLGDLAKYSMTLSVARSLRQLSFLLLIYYILYEPAGKEERFVLFIDRA